MIHDKNDRFYEALQQELDEEDEIIRRRISAKKERRILLQESKKRKEEAERKRKLKELRWWEAEGLPTLVHYDHPTVLWFDPEAGYGAGSLKRKYYTHTGASVNLPRRELEKLVDREESRSQDVFPIGQLFPSYSKTSNLRKLALHLRNERNKYTLICPLPREYHSETHREAVTSNTDSNHPDLELSYSVSD